MKMSLLLQFNTCLMVSPAVALTLKVSFQGLMTVSRAELRVDTKCLPWTTLEEDYILTWGPVLKPVVNLKELSTDICLVR
jgi:hypothetical protein